MRVLLPTRELAAQRLWRLCGPCGSAKAEKPASPLFYCCFI